MKTYFKNLGMKIGVELTDEMKKDRDAFTAYAAHVINMIAATY